MLVEYLPLVRNRLYLENETSGGDEGDTAGAKEGYKVPEGRGERQRGREIQLIIVDVRKSDEEGHYLVDPVCL